MITTCLIGIAADPAGPTATSRAPPGPGVSAVAASGTGVPAAASALPVLLPIVVVQPPSATTAARTTTSRHHPAPTRIKMTEPSPLRQVRAEGGRGSRAAAYWPARTEPSAHGWPL